jgi:hypothetical protein
VLTKSPDDFVNTPPPVRPPEPPQPVLKSAPVVEAPRRTETVPAPAPAPVEFGRVVKAASRSERAGRALASGDRLLSGDTVSCALGTLLIELPDDSLLVLKSGASVLLQRHGDDVALRLAEGEIACSVRKGPARRFSVESPHGTVTVKGTVFGVRTVNGSASVVVARGRVEVRNERGSQDLAAGERASLSRSAAPGRPEAVNADRALAWAFDAGLRVVGPIWIVAGSGELQAPMAKGRLFAAGSLSGEPVFAAVDSRTLPGWNGRFLPPGQADGGSVAFTVELPHAGAWSLWGRFYYPATGTQLWRQDAEPRENDPNSFFVSVDGGREAVFGNLKQDAEAKASGYRRWHWAGNGTVEVGAPSALPLGTLAAGRHVIRIRNRDAVETSALHLAPRLDALCLSPDRDYRPRDEDFRR